MKYLVDVDVLSEPTKPSPEPGTCQWLRRHATQLIVNPIILGELQIGIHLLPAGRRRAELLDWYEEGVRTLPAVDIDVETAEEWAQLIVSLRRKGRQMPIKDSLIAASARQHELPVATRNVADFKFAGVKVVNPFDGG